MYYFGSYYPINSWNFAEEKVVAKPSVEEGMQPPPPPPGTRYKEAGAIASDLAKRVKRYNPGDAMYDAVSRDVQKYVSALPTRYDNAKKAADAASREAADYAAQLQNERDSHSGANIFGHIITGIKGMTKGAYLNKKAAKANSEVDNIGKAVEYFKSENKGPNSHYTDKANYEKVLSEIAKKREGMTDIQKPRNWLNKVSDFLHFRNKTEKAQAAARRSAAEDNAIRLKALREYQSAVNANKFSRVYPARAYAGYARNFARKHAALTAYYCNFSRPAYNYSRPAYYIPYH